jgi:excisionase family DNA binding protein
MGAYPIRSDHHASVQPSNGAINRSETARASATSDTPLSPGQRRHAIDPIAMRVPDACRYIGISRSTLYILIAEGEIEIVKLGCSTLVLTESLKTLIAKRRGHATNSFDQHAE